MAIRKWVREEVEKYTFITGTAMKFSTVYFYYEKDGKKLYKKLPYRSDKNKIIDMIERIKKDIGYKEKKATMDLQVSKAIKKDNEKDKTILLGMA